MKTSIKTGLEGTQRIVVDAARVTRHLDEYTGVYATPAMINDIENLCRRLLAKHLDTGEESVGTRVEIQHLAPTPEGMAVDISARIAGVDGRAVTFEAVARDAVDEVGRCIHHRFIVDVPRLKERLNAKTAKGGAG